MNHVALLAAALGTACTAEDYFVLDYEPHSLGAGLEYRFTPMRIVCESGQDFPYQCSQHRAAIDRVTARGAGEIRATDPSTFTLLGLTPGTALVDLDATAANPDDTSLQLSDTFEVPVLPIAYSQLGWYSNDTITEPTGAAFRSSTVTVWQHHYREPRTTLVGALPSVIIDAELAGDAPFTLDAGTTSAALATTDGSARHTTTVATGDVLGTATVGTTAGGTFPLDIVDESSITRLEARHDPDSFDALGSIVIHPFDASDRPIVGCPLPGPTIIDTAGAVVVAATGTTSWTTFCELELAWNQSPIDTTVVVTWGSREARIAIDVSQ